MGLNANDMDAMYGPPQTGQEPEPRPRRRNGWRPGTVLGVVALSAATFGLGWVMGKGSNSNPPPMPMPELEPDWE